MKKAEGPMPVDWQDEESSTLYRKPVKKTTHPRNLKRKKK
jgi:hypothetical protein